MSVASIATIVKKTKHDIEKQSTTHNIVSLVDKKGLLSASESESLEAFKPSWENCRHLKILNEKEHCTQFMSYCRKNDCPPKFRQRKE